MTSTGHILGTAVMAADIFSRKKKSLSKTASIEAALELAESSKYMNDRLQNQSALIWRFSPLIIFSPVELAEGILLNLIEVETSATFDAAITKKTTGILDTTYENGMKKGILSPENKTRIEKLTQKPR